MSAHSARSWLTELRKQHNLTPTQLAFHIGVTERAVRSWESGQRVPGRPHQMAMANLFGDRSILDRFDAEIEANPFAVDHDPTGVISEHPSVLVA